MTQAVVDAPDFAVYESARQAEILGRPAPEPEPAKEDPKPDEVPTESTPEATETEAKTEPESGTGEPARKGGFQRRIDKLTQRIRELEAQTLAGKTAVSEPPPAQFDSERPKIENFESLEAWKDADDDWKAAKRQEAYQQQKADAHFAEQMDKARAKFADFDDVMASVDVEISNDAARALRESDVAGELAYWLAKRPEEAEKLASMSYGAAARFLGRIEAQIAEQPKPKQNRVSSAPPPPASVAARSKPASNDPYEEGIDVVEFEKRWRAAQLAKR
jgi:hypothetical protein